MEIEDKYLSSANVKDGDIFEICDTGTKEIIDNKFKIGTKKEIYNFEVQKDGKRYIYSPNNTSLKSLIKAFGRNTDKWLMCKFQVKLALTTSGSYAIMAQPIVAEKV